MASAGRQRYADVISIADNHGRTHQYQQAEYDEEFGAASGTLPLVQRNPPQSAEDDDAGHVQSPTGKLVSSHLGLAHGVEEKLHVPGGAGER